MRQLDNWIEGYMEYTENTEPPELYRIWTSIACIAAVLERKCYLNWGHQVFYPNMYIVLVGPSGKCRKGTAMGAGRSILSEIGINLAAEAVTREALIRELRNAEQTITDPQTGDVFFHSSLSVFSPELTVFLGYNNVQLMADLCDWFDCGPSWTYRTKGSGTDEITGVWMNLFGATTPELIKSTLPTDAIGGGLSSRMIFVYAEKKGKVVPRPFLTKEDVEIRDKLIADLDFIHTLRGEFKLSKQFIDAYDNWYVRQEDEPPFEDKKFMGYNSRRQLHLLKICMVLSAATRDDMMLTGDIFHNGLALLARTETLMPKVYQGMGESELSTIMHDVMKDLAINKKMKRRELYAKHMNNVGTLDSFEDVINSMKAIGMCKWDVANDMLIYVEGSRPDLE